MSIRIMAMAWEIPMPATNKLVLMALCDWSNDAGLCFPSMLTIAKRTCISKRQCQRIMSKFVAENLIAVIANQRGGALSKRYQINVTALVQRGPNATEDKMSPVVSAPRPPETPVSQAGDAHVTRTVSNHKVEPSLLLKFEALDWTYLSTLQDADRVVVVNLLKGLEQSMHQELLDELAGARRANAIKTQWPAWLRGVVRRAQGGAFVANHALSIRQDRHSRKVLAEENAKRLERQKLEAERKNNPEVRARNLEAMAAALVAITGKKS